MTGMNTILLIDNRDSRRSEICRRIKSIPGFLARCRKGVSRGEYEKGGFGAVIVHRNNQECDGIEGYWSNLGVPVVIFSGGFVAEMTVENGTVYVNDKVLDSVDGIRSLLEMVFTQ
jgi:hypothetical protein